MDDELYACEDCFYFRNRQCWRYPPAVVVQSGLVKYEHPTVLSDGFCGEFNHKDS